MDASQADTALETLKKRDHRKRGRHQLPFVSSMKRQSISGEGKEQYVNQYHHQYGGKDQPPIIRLHR
jgi:hypothetical protein